MTRKKRGNLGDAVAFRGLSNPARNNPAGGPFGKDRTMRRRATVALTLLTLLAAAPLLAACHTTAGAGEDLSKTGQAIENSADKHTP